MLSIPPNWGTFITLIVSFLVFWFIMKRLLFDPYLSLLERRSHRLNELKEDAERVLREASELERRYTQELAEVRRRALAERESARRQALEEAGEIVRKAREEVRQMLDTVEREVEIRLQEAYQQIDTLSRALAWQIAEQALGRPISSTESEVSLQ